MLSFTQRCLRSSNWFYRRASIVTRHPFYIELYGIRPKTTRITRLGDSNVRDASMYKDRFDSKDRSPSSSSSLTSSSRTFNLISMAEKTKTDDLNEKINFFVKAFEITTIEERQSLISAHYVLFGDSLNEIKKKMEFFQRLFEFSKTKKLKEFYFHEKHIVLQSYQRLQSIYQFITQELNITNVSSIKELFQIPQFTKNYHLKIINKEFIEKKLFLQKLFQLSFPLATDPSQSWSCSSSMTNKPWITHKQYPILLLSLKEIRRRISMIIKGFGITDIKELQQILSNHAKFINNDDQIIIKCHQTLSLFSDPSQQIPKGNEELISFKIDSKQASALKKEFKKRFHAEFKEQSLDATPASDAATVPATSSPINLKKEPQEKDDLIFRAFLADKKETVKLSRKSHETTKRAKKTRSNTTNLILSAAAQPLSIDINNPYHYLLRKCAEEGDLLKRLQGYDDVRALLDSAVIAGNRKGFIHTTEKKGVGLLALYMLQGKEVEKIVYSHNIAVKSCISSGYLSRSFTESLVTLITLVNDLQLNETELKTIAQRIARWPKLQEKLLVIALAAEQYILTGHKGGPRGLEAWKEGIRKEMTLDEVKEVYRNHPIISLTRELILRNPTVLSCTLPRIIREFSRREETRPRMKSLPTVRSQAKEESKDTNDDDDEDQDEDEDEDDDDEEEEDDVAWNEKDVIVKEK